MAFIGLPILIRPRVTCERCGLMYRKKRNECPHCAHLSEGPELEALKTRRDERLASGQQLGGWFLFIMAILILLVITIAM